MCVWQSLLGRCEVSQTCTYLFDKLYISSTHGALSRFDDVSLEDGPLPPQHHSPETKAAEEINSSETSRTFQSNSSPTNHAVNWHLTVCICTTNLLLDAKDVCVSMRTFGWLVMSWQEVTRSVCFCFGVFAGSLIGLRPLTDLVPTHLPTSGLCDKAE